MVVLSVAYPLLPVSADSAGGAEQVLYTLERGLVAAGIRSLVVAASGSQIRGKLFATTAVDSEITEAVHREAQQAHLHCIEQVLRREAVDLLHFHGLDFHAYLPKSDVRKIVTLHLPLTWYPSWIFDLTDIHFVCVSHHQASQFQGKGPLSVIENGVETDWRDAPTSHRDSLLWIGRICLEKGTHLALEAAHRLDRRLTVAGVVHPFQSHQDYFRDLVAPLLDEKRRYIGPVGADEKARLLSRARALLVPSLAPETSSLVAMEALSAGVPVIAFRSGALPEVVEHGGTGWIVDSLDEMVKAIENVDEISANQCREAALTRFSAGRMVNDYLSLYSRLPAGHNLATGVFASNNRNASR